MPPEVRISSASSDGKVSLTFTNEMIVPGNFTELLNVRNGTEIYTLISKFNMEKKNFEDPRWFIDEGVEPDVLLEILMLRYEHGETLRGNLTSWTVLEANSTNIEIKLVFY
jgi:hypothetical protein